MKQMFSNSKALGKGIRLVGYLSKYENSSWKDFNIEILKATKRRLRPLPMHYLPGFLQQYVVSELLLAHVASKDGQR